MAAVSMAKNSEFCILHKNLSLISAASLIRKGELNIFLFINIRKAWEIWMTIMRDLYPEERLLGLAKMLRRTLNPQGLWRRTRGWVWSLPSTGSEKDVYHILNYSEEANSLTSLRIHETPEVIWSDEEECLNHKNDWYPLKKREMHVW